MCFGCMRNVFLPDAHSNREMEGREETKRTKDKYETNVFGNKTHERKRKEEDK